MAGPVGEDVELPAADTADTSMREVSGSLVRTAEHGHRISGAAPLHPVGRDVLLGLQEAVVAVSPAGIVLLYNSAAQRLWGWQSEEAMGQHVEMLLGAGTDLAAARTQRLRTRHKDGRGLFLRVSVSEVLLEITPGDPPQAARRVISEDVAEDPDYLQLNAIVDLATFPVVACSRSGEIIKFNKAAAKVFRIEQAEAPGLHVLKLFQAGAASGRPAAEVLEGYVGTGPRSETGVRLDGTNFPMRLSVSRVDTTDCFLFTLLMEDITQELASKNSLLAEQRKTAAIMNSALNAILTTDGQGYLELANTSACNIFGLVQGQTDGKSIASLIQLEDGSRPPADRMGQYLSEAAGKVRELTGCRSDGTVFPMRMSISEVNSDGQHLFTAILRDITKERQDQARVQAEQRKTAAIMNSALNAIITTDGQGYLELVNTSACRIFGLVQGQTDGKSIASLIQLEDGSIPSVDSMAQYLSEAAGKVRELTGCRSDGTVFPMRMSISEVNSDGQHLFTAILRDITKERQDQARVQAEQRKTAAIMNSALNAIITTDGQGYFELVNTSACRIFGLVQGQTDGKSIASLIRLEDGSRPPADSMGQYLSEAAGKVRELTGCRSDGTVFPMRMSISEVNSDGQHLFTAILRDITKERQDQARVQAEQRKTAAIMDSALNAIITTDSQGMIELINTSACSTFQVDQPDATSMNIASLMADEDGNCFLVASIGQYLHKAAGTVRELMGRRSNGDLFPMRMSISEVSSDGQHLFTAILRDVTREKEDQARLEAATQIIKLERAKLRALLDSTVEGFIVVNNVGIIESFNQSAIKIFGYNQDEIVGQNVSVLIGNRRAGRHHTKYMANYISKGKGAGVVGHAREVTAMRKNGTEFQILLSISETILNGEYFFTATVRDLSNELLLMNMLPASIAARLKANDGPIHDGHENVSILFADICGFTALSSTLTAYEVVSFLNDIFRDFDELADTYQLEKIKTIGDCYMVVSGVPEASQHHALKLACFAIEMREALLRYNKRSNLAQPLSMRIGMHSGPVIAGVVGKRKFLYDIWGDSVNVASRMESTGTPGQIQISDAMKELVGEWFELEDRGMVAVKGKGDLHTWMLKAPIPAEEERLVDELVEALTDALNQDSYQSGASLNLSQSSFLNMRPKLGPVFGDLWSKYAPEDRMS
eukprot:jgi/Tetstr1/439852/TSEL_028263.t1